MEQYSLFTYDGNFEQNSNQLTPLGNDLFLEFKGSFNKSAILYRNGCLIKSVDLSDKVAMKLLVIDAVTLGGEQKKLAEKLGISRQTIYNYIQAHKEFGNEGLIYSFNPTVSRSRKKQRQLHASQLIHGNKAKKTAEIRAKRNEQNYAKQEQINFSFLNENQSSELSFDTLPFDEQHDWESSRYTGIFIYWIPLIAQSHWLQLVLSYFGSGWRIFSLFLLMAAKNIRSIEQVKHVRSREAGIVLGLKNIPSKSTLWSWFYEASNLGLSRDLLNDYFRHQIIAGYISTWLWATDGHLLPYTGKEKVHYSYSTQRKMPMPGRTSQVTCDHTGRIVDFTIDEGKGDMKNQIIEVVKKWQPVVSSQPISVFDREGYDSGFFSKLVKAGQPFVTWDKNVNSSRLSNINDDSFTHKFTFNNKNYSVLEEEKSFSYSPVKDSQPHEYTLRHLIIWNHSSDRRTCGLAYGEFNTIDATKAILSRWGASENTFKHINNRHPLHYHPGFKMKESEHQEIANPKIKEKQKLIAKLISLIGKLHKKIFNSKEYLNKDGTPRKNGTKQRLHDEILLQQAELEYQRKEKNSLPKKIDVSGLDDYRSFKRIDNDGKYLFDFVTVAVWNTRKQVVDWLREYYEYENDVVDLFYAITNVHGWVRSTATEVRVRLEPLQQAKRRAAQEQLCRKLSALGAQTPTGKIILIEVGESPLK